jgi:hypothetical protein
MARMKHFRQRAKKNALEAAAAAKEKENPEIAGKKIFFFRII